MTIKWGKIDNERIEQETFQILMHLVIALNSSLYGGGGGGFAPQAVFCYS